MTSPPLLSRGHWPASGARRRGRPPAPERRPGACPRTGPRPPWPPDGRDNLSGRAQILLAASSQLDQRIHERISLERMCRLLELDAHNLTAAFKQFHGCTMSCYLRQFRVRCLFHAMAAEPQASLRSQCQRFGLGPTPSERRCFRSQFDLSIDAHQARCQANQAGDRAGAVAQAPPSAVAEALERLATPSGTASSPGSANGGRPAPLARNGTGTAAQPPRQGV